MSTKNWKELPECSEKEFPVRKTLHGKRHYVLEKERLAFPSVTTVLSALNDDWLRDWKNRIGEEKANKISNQSATSGTAMHGIAESVLRNEKMIDFDRNPFAKFQYLSIKDQIEKINNIYMIESFLFSRRLGIAGTVDCVAEYDGSLAVIDFKTSRKKKKREWIDSYFAQAYAYACMLYELYSLKTEKLVILIGCTDGGQVFEEKPQQKHMDYLQKALKAYGKKKKNR